MISIDSYIDHIFFINLEKRTDRRVEIDQELLNIGLVGERFNAFEHTIGSVGCELSHLAVLKLAKERNYKNVLILEDDFQVLVSKEEFDKNIFLFFNSQIDYDVCFLAYNVIQSEDVPEYPFIKRGCESQTSSAYIINNHYYDKLINLFEKNVPLLENTNHHWLYAVDQVWKPLQKTDQWYYFTERIGKQRDGYSDNTERMETYNC